MAINVSIRDVKNIISVQVHMLLLAAGLFEDKGREKGPVNVYIFSNPFLCPKQDYFKIMCQSVPSLTIPPSQTQGKFFERVNFPLLEHKESAKHPPWGRKIVLNPTPGVIIFINAGKNNT